MKRAFLIISILAVLAGLVVLLENSSLRPRRCEQCGASLTPYRPNEFSEVFVCPACGWQLDTNFIPPNP
jgi:transposase